MSDGLAACAICGAPVPSGPLPGLLYLGRRWYFCGQSCRLTFKRDPERWAAARPEAGEPVVAGPLPRERPASPFRVRSGR